MVFLCVDWIIVCFSIPPLVIMNKFSLNVYGQLFLLFFTFISMYQHTYRYTCVMLCTEETLLDHFSLFTRGSNSASQVWWPSTSTHWVISLVPKGSYLCVCMLSVCIPYYTEVRGQLVGVGFLLPRAPRGSVSGTFIHWAIWLASVPFYICPGYLDFQGSWENYVLSLDSELCTSFWTLRFERKGGFHP